ncbi:MAG: 2-C-methyl-D-erythritol 4-phosphate cytidylyltransferase [Deltaproteobacteria bacterium]|jgi:2-C-methyl-D-erythritol 4-phosphate cytidylyltransferase|nr:2-C-methyl-D-erythritol 4-phosphate cytidylyltransferase [Deltaproteobacteria bacterium]MBT4089131.1 2-C-methyl-D-erythritol 4-phosphate cytidylyltransferase [Deltaproteobacteria bacterium]MBT4263918.1 2-C-methyl-D-erythritol 4-phosphate cytidylyltransferase [Deltaproteobacteria bacterium]MBT4639861.1 2-C-methyl-D-erythritol 4-phosphate cytidylyltransferase [Deltaproteobacteria bacterium]MBT6503454.1 2-C-methyl-D-erythritol 4-phosphate cytidylyltransferase [Deltaproteobacteria bacterium]
MNIKEPCVDMVVLAAGKGTRMKSATNKMYQKIKGVPLIYRTLYRLNALSIVRRIIVVIREDEGAVFDDMLCTYGALHKVEGVVNGGIERHESVRRGLNYIHKNPLSGIVMTHDGARPFVTALMMERLAKSSQEKTVTIPVINVNETVRRRHKNGATQIVDRDQLFITQTPQAFKYDDIATCFLAENQQKLEFTDEAGYFEHLGLAVSMVDGEKSNIKVTTKEDLVWSEFLLENSTQLRLDPFD